jgi:hypothetical protein
MIGERGVGPDAFMRTLVPLLLMILLPAMANAETLCFRLEDPNNVSLGYIDVKLVIQPSCKVTSSGKAPRISSVHGALNGVSRPRGGSSRVPDEATKTRCSSAPKRWAGAAR